MYARRIYGTVPVNQKFVCNSTCCTVAATPPTCSTLAPAFFGPPLLPPYGAIAGQYEPSAFYQPQLVRNDGWVEVGWIVSECRPPKPKFYEKEEEFCESCAPAPRQNWRRNHQISARKNRPAQWKPRADYQCNQHGCTKHNTVDDEEFHCNDQHYEQQGTLNVTCRTRRYRLYARPAYGWRGSCDTNLLQYAVTEESISRHDAIFVVLPDDPRIPPFYDGQGHHRRFGSQRFQPLQSYDHVWVPGECTVFIVHLYADEWHH